MQPVKANTHKPRDYLFNPSGIFWRVNRQAALLIGGGSALLMQIAHPKIAAAVNDHSSFREQPFRRLYRTINAMQDIIFADRETGLATASRIREIHGRVHGTLRESTAVYPQGTAYSAEDGDLVVWVFATLIETMLRTHAVLFAPLSDLEKESFYRESRQIAALLGAPDDLVPPTFPAFEHYFRNMLDGPVLEITSAAKSIARDLMDPRSLPIPTSVISIPAIALLPTPLRDRFGFVWDARRQLAWDLAQSALRGAVQVAPEIVGVMAGARVGERR